MPLMPSLAINEGLVVTPSRIPSSFASFICARFAVSIKNFIPELFYSPPAGGSGGKKMAGLLHRTAQPPTLAAFRPWEGSAGAGRVRPAAAKIGE